MATKVQRATSILNALADPATIDAAKLTKIADAYAYTYRRGETLTGAEKAGLFIQVTRDQIQQIVRDAIQSQAAKAAADAADVVLDIGSDGV